MIGEIKGKSNEIVFRIDRFIEYSVTNERFSVMYKDRFKEGEFLNKIQYMYTGELVKIQFKFRGRSLEAVLDRLPTANVITYDNEVPIIEAEVYWEGVKRWILSQQQYIEVIKPEEFRSVINLDYIYTMDLIRHLLVYNAYEGESAEKSILNGWLNLLQGRGIV